MAQNNWLDEGSTPVPQPTSAAADTSWLDEQSDISQDNALVRGFKKSSQSIGITKGLVTGDSADTARKVAEAADYARKNPGTKEGAELMDAWNRGDGVTGGVTEVAGEFAKDWRNAKGFIPGVRATAKNLQAMGSGIVEQVPNMIAPVAGMIAGGAAGSAAAGPVGTVLGGWAGASLGNTAVEGGSMVQEALQKHKINPADQAAVSAYLDKNGDRILGQAGVKGAIIGAVDTATAGLGHFLLSGPGKAAASRALADMGVDAADKAAVRAAQSSAAFKNRIASDAAYQATQQGANKIARNAGAAALEPAGEFAGEFVGQGVATGEWDTKNAALEAASSIGQSGAMYAGQKAIQAFSRPGAATNDPSEQPVPAPGQPPAADTPPADVPPGDGQAGPGGGLGAPTGAGADMAGMLAPANPLLEAMNQRAADPSAIAPPIDDGKIFDKSAAAPVAGELYQPGDTTNPLTGERITAKPSEAMGINPADGPLSTGAALAVDTGVSEQMQQAAALAEAVKAAPKTPAGEAKTAAPDLSGWSDQQLSDTFRAAQAPDVRRQLVAELQRRRDVREQQSLRQEMDAERAALDMPDAPDDIFASVREDAGEPEKARFENTPSTEARKESPVSQQPKEASSGAQTQETQQAGQGQQEARAAQAGARDESHLNALELRLSHERGRLRAAKTDAERATRQVTVDGIEREIAGERKFLGLAPQAASAMSDDALMQALKPDGAEKTSTAQPPLSGTISPQPQAAGPALAAPEFTTIKTVHGDSVTVRTSDLQGDAPRLRQYTKAGKAKAVPAIHRDNLDLTGEKSAERAKENAKNPLFHTVTTKDGGAFASQAAAQREVNRLGLQDSHEVVEAGGGFVGRIKKTGEQHSATARNLRLADERTPGAGAAAPHGPGESVAGEAPVVGAGQRQTGDAEQPGTAVRAVVPDAAGASQPDGGVGPAAQQESAAKKTVAQRDEETWTHMGQDAAAPQAEAAQPATPQRGGNDFLPEGWTKSVNGFTKRPVYRMEQGVGQPFAVVTQTEGMTYEVQIRHGDKQLTTGAQRGALSEVLAAAEAELGRMTQADSVTHADPGEKAEAATPAVVTDSLKKAASNEDTKPSEMRKWLVAEIDKELLQAPDRADYDEAVKRLGEKDAISMFTGNGPLGKNSETGFITFDVPGDGKYKVRNSVRGLLEFRKNVMASQGFKDSGQKQVKPEQNRGVQGGSGGSMAAITNMIEEGDFEAARDYAEAVGIKLEDVKVPRGDMKPAWEKYLKDGTLPPAPDTRPQPAPKTAAQQDEEKRQAAEAEAKKPKDTGWNMAGTGYGGKRYIGRNITLDDGREVVARVYENAGTYEEAEVKVDGVRKFTVTDRDNAQGKADAFIRTLQDGDQAAGSAKSPTRVTPQISGNPEKFIKVAADSVRELRSVDVDRVLTETPVQFRAEVASYIRDQRKDLADEVDDVMADIQPMAAAPAPAPATTGARRDPAKVSMFNPYEDGDIVTIDGQDWTVKADTPGWYLTTTGNWRGQHPTIRNVKAMADLIREVEQAAEAKPASAGRTYQSAYDAEVERMHELADKKGVPASGINDDLSASLASLTIGRGFNQSPDEFLSANPAQKGRRDAMVAWRNGQIDHKPGQSEWAKRREKAQPAAESDTPKLTQSEAKELMEWQDLGQKDGVKTHALTFYESQADKDAKRGRMIVAKVTKGDRSASNWMVDGDDKPLAVLGMAKKRAEDAGMARLVADGYVGEAPTTGPKPARITPDIAANMKAGDVVVDEDGKEYRANAARHGWLEAHPIVDGKAQVNADSRVMFHLDPQTASAYPERSHKAVFLKEEAAEANPLADYNALAQEYGFEVRPDGAIGSDGKFPGPKMKVKGGRLRIESGSGDLLASYASPAPQSLGKFLESFWYAQKKAPVDGAGKTAEPASDRDHFTLERLNRETDRMEPVTFQRGETVKIAAGKRPYPTGVITGISHAERKFRVDGNEYGHDFGYAYKVDFDELARPRQEVDDSLNTLEQRLNEGNAIQSEGFIRSAKEVIERNNLGDYAKDRMTQLARRAADVSKSVLDKMRAAKAEKEQADAQKRAEDQAKVAEPKPPIEMTMGEWKAVSKDFKGMIDGKRTVMREGGMRFVTIIPSKAADSKTPTVDAHDALMASVREGRATPEQFKSGFEAVVAGKEAINAELSAKTKAQLLEVGGPQVQWRHANSTKPDIVDAIYHEMLRDYALGETITHGLARDSYQNAVRRLVEATDDDKLAQFVKEREAALEESKTRREATAKAMENPQTLDDFRALMRAKVTAGMSQREAFLSLTPEQRIRYDDLAAESTRAAREANKQAQKTQVQAAGQTTGGEIIETKHTRDGYDLFVVQLADRLSKEDYQTVAASAKKLGGWYSSFRGNGATPGFQFKDRANAEAFLKLAGGDTGAAQEQVGKLRDAFEDDRSQTAAQRLSAMADKLESSATEEENRDRKTNTGRRARFARAALDAAASDKALAKTMRNIAKAIESGRAKFLDMVRTKTQVDFLANAVKTAKDAELRAKYPSYADQEKRKGEPATAETADHADFPSYSAFRSDLAMLARHLLEVDGTKKLGQRLMSVADDVTDAYMEFAKENLSSVSQFGTKSGGLAEYANREAAERAIRRSGLTGRAIVLPIKRGENRIILSPSEAINKGIWTGDGDKRITLTRDFGNELVQAIGRRGNRQNKLAVPWQFQNAHDRLKMLERMGIQTSSEFRAALREFISLKEEAVQNRARTMELEMVGRKADGLDFFPTPATVADQMVEAADLTPDMAVLEPSAGIGHLADRIRAAGAEPDVIEMSGERRELLEEKGYRAAGEGDFLSLKPREFFTFGDVFRAPDGTEGIMRGANQGRVRLEDEQGKYLGFFDRDELTGVRHRGTESGYDRIIMNPPFSDGRDIQHVQHAYELLRPGGRIVAIMGEGAFFQSNKRAESFREWLEERGATSEKLPEGSFMDPSLPVNTSVNARMVVIDKPAAAQDGDANFGARQRAASGTPTDRAVMDMLREGRSAKDVLGMIAGTSRSRFNRQVARLLLRTGVTPKVEALAADGLGKDKRGFNLLAKYSRDSNTISLTEGAGYMAEQIMLHELIHAATLRALDRKGLASLQMKRLFAHVQKQGVLDGTYGMKNVGEFTSEAFTNPDFQRELRKIKGMQDGGAIKTAWDGFVRILRSILGLPNDSHDALSQALQIGVGVMRDQYRMGNRGERGGHNAYMAARNVAGQDSASDDSDAYFGMADARAMKDGALAKSVGDGLRAITQTNIKQLGKHKLTDWLNIGLQFLGRRQLVDIYGDLLPLAEYNRLVQQMEADKNEGGAEADQLVTRWAKLSDETKLADLMHDATLAQIDPDKPYADGDDKAVYMMLQGRFKTLSDDAKAVYRATRDAYRAHHAKVRSAIKERIERSEIKGERKAALLKQMDDEFFKAIKGVYFPLARFGQYAVTVKGPEGKVESVSRAETKAEAEALRSNLLAAFPRDKGFTVGRVMLSKDFIADRDAVGRGFMTELYQVLDKQDIDAAQRAELEDTLGQLYLSSLPDLSWAKHGIHRKGTPGFSQDARRAFAQNMFHGARYLAKLRYSDLMQDELAAMQKHVDDWREVEDFDQNSAQRVVDEMNKRHESLMNPKSNPLSTALTSLGFVFHLGMSPASAMVNLSQTALVAYPIMGAKWGFNKASAALLKASKEAAAGKNDITGSLNADERAAYDEAVRAGTIDVTMAHDLAGIAQGEDAGVMWKIRPVMRWASFLFHNAERFNRQVTFVAAYRLARDAGANHKVAFDQATKATYDGHFDYGAANRPRIMQGNVAKVLLLFKQYGQNMVYTLSRNAYQSIKGTDAEKAEARKALAGLLTSHAMAAGVLGLPMVSTLLAAASMVGGDDDEPWDAKVALQNMLADAFGQKPAEVLAHGLSRLTPWDISGRVGLDRLIFPDVQEGLEGQRLAESAMAAALGPVAGIGVNVLKGAQHMSEGRYAMGLEAMLPSALRGPVKALRYAEEGVQDKSGISILDQVSPAAVTGQALGFSPSAARNAQEGKSAILAHDRALGERRQELLTKIARATMAKDEEAKAEAREEIKRFNEKNPGRRINPNHIMASVHGRQKRINQAQDGVYLPRNRREAMEVGRFALAESE